MSEKDWDDIPKEELLGIADSILYLKRHFSTDVGHPKPSAPKDDKHATEPNSGK